MKLPNGYGSVVKLSGKRRKPWMVRKTTGYRIDPVKEKKVNEYIIMPPQKLRGYKCWLITTGILMIRRQPK